ncbi:hypothetical protein P9G84_19065 [Brevibacillus centrosporus]|uniref:hypothetical protein n=1 Tax=Brevibacillus centrosporus TaxID=54910 RepID=UPI000F09CF2E|nr:hypothetical protein [Brevibacillus centrosporus]MEC2131027.1 hypothetical protein [Brevibacillus centrosporus]RNB72888.1 hypothetical protein EDM55_03330 [Brevibacillus centrosporus]GED32363.1 hypothetical protein BCE02nite_35040 [Brevibacillus centrosporus]
MKRNSKKEKQKLKITSISFVHDPDAAKKWFNIFVEIVADHMLEKASNEYEEQHIMKPNTTMGESDE